MSSDNHGFPASPTVLNAPAPLFPPLSSQPPSPRALQRAFLNPPFIWKGVPLRAFRHGGTGNLTELAPPEEKGHFYSTQHQKRYKSLKKHLQQDLEDLARRHRVENKLELAIRAAAEEREIKDFHEDFMKRLDWGKGSSSLLVRVDPYVGVVREGGELKVRSTRSTESRQEDGQVKSMKEEPSVLIAKFSENGQGSPFPSTRAFFRHYPAISISLAVRDFYRRLERKREEFGNALEFQQMWEWSERHWNFYEAVSHLREWAREEKANEGAGDGDVGATASASPDPQTSAEEPDGYGSTIDWTPELEDRKRRHQWAILRKIKEAFEINEEDFPDICAPAGRTLDSYFAIGKYGSSEKWYPVDPELEGKGKGGIKEAIEQIACFEDVLAAGGTLAQASMAVIKRNKEKASRVTAYDECAPETPAVQGKPQAGAIDGESGEPAKASMHGALEANKFQADRPDDGEEDSTRAFIAALRARLIGGVNTLTQVSICPR